MELWKWISGDHLLQSSAGQLKQLAQSHVQLGSECVQGWRLCNLSGCILAMGRTDVSQQWQVKGKDPKESSMHFCCSHIQENSSSLSSWLIFPKKLVALHYLIAADFACQPCTWLSHFLVGFYPLSFTDQFGPILLDPMWSYRLYFSQQSFILRKDPMVVKAKYLILIRTW